MTRDGLMKVVTSCIYDLLNAGDDDALLAIARVYEDWQNESVIYPMSDLYSNEGFLADFATVGDVLEQFSEVYLYQSYFFYRMDLRCYRSTDDLVDWFTKSRVASIACSFIENPAAYRGTALWDEDLAAIAGRVC